MKTIHTTTLLTVLGLTLASFVPIEVEAGNNARNRNANAQQQRNRTNNTQQNRQAVQRQRALQRQRAAQRQQVNRSQDTQVQPYVQPEPVVTLSDIERTILNRINQVRAQHGLSALRVSPIDTQAAKRVSGEIVQYGGFYGSFSGGTVTGNSRCPVYNGDLNAMALAMADHWIEEGSVLSPSASLIGLGWGYVAGGNFGTAVLVQ